MIVKNMERSSTNCQYFKPQTSTKQINLRLEDCEIIYSVEVANEFNSYFSSLGNDLVRTIPSIAKKTPKDYLHNRIQPLKTTVLSKPLEII